MLRYRANTEHGASALLLASSLILLMGMAAIAIDVGAGFNERRQNQTGSDVGVLAGALEFTVPADIVDQSLELVRRNLTNSLAANSQQYADIWLGCADPDRPGSFFPLPVPPAWVSSGWTSAGTTLDCLSQSDSEVRLRLPDQFTATTFGRVLGVDELTTSAVAVASVSPGVKGAGVLPFAVRGGQGAGEVCLKTSSTGTIQPPCPPSTSGSFGTIISPAFGDEFFPTTPNCNPNQVLAQNIAVGIDHTIVPYQGSDWTGYPISGQPPARNTVITSDANTDMCSTSSGIAVASDGVPINAVEIDTGNVQNPVTDGLVSNAMFLGGTRPSRLQLPSPSQRNYRSGAETWSLDNQGLHEFLLNDAHIKVPATYTIGSTSYNACEKTAYDGNALSPEEKAQLMSECLKAHATLFPAVGEDPDDDSSAVIFHDDLANAPRFAWAPRLLHTELPDGTRFDMVHDFTMVYVAGVFFNCNNSGCDAVFYPDDEVAGSVCVSPPGSCKQLGVSQVSGLVMPQRAVAASVRGNFPFGTLQWNLQPILIE